MSHFQISSKQYSNIQCNTNFISTLQWVCGCVCVCVWGGGGEGGFSVLILLNKLHKIQENEIYIPKNYKEMI